VKSCSESYTVIAGRRLDIDFIEMARLKQFAISRAIESDPTRERQFSHTGAGTEVTADVKQSIFENFLQGGGHVAMLVRDLLFRLAFLNEASS